MTYNNDPQPSVKRQVLSRVGWKLLIVGLAVAAFFGLNSLEGAKTSYQKDQVAPLVIGDFGSSMTQPKGSKPETGRAIGLDYREVQKLLEDVLYPATDEDKKSNKLAVLKRTLEEKKYAEPVIASIMESPMRMRDKILHSISRAATVRDENALIGSITESIDEARTAEEKRATDERDAKLGIYKKVSESYPNNPKAFVEQLNNKDVSLGEVLRQRLGNSADVSVANLIETATEVEKNRLDQKVIEINGFAHVNYGRVYSTAFPKALSDYVQRQRVVSLDRNDFSSRILDATRGEYAIYQAGYLTCVVLLVFGLLYPIYLLLRLLPPFAASLDPLADQAKAIISGRTAAGAAGATLAAPGIAKTLALSVAAVGIGTAVAVANNGSSPTSKQPTELASMAPLERDLILDPKLRKLINEVTKGDNPTPTPTPQDQSRIAQLEAKLAELETSPRGPGPNLSGFARTGELAALRTAFRDLNLTGPQVERT